MKDKGLLTRVQGLGTPGCPETGIPIWTDYTITHIVLLRGKKMSERKTLNVGVR